METLTSSPLPLPSIPREEKIVSKLIEKMCAWEAQVWNRVDKVYDAASQGAFSCLSLIYVSGQGVFSSY